MSSLFGQANGDDPKVPPASRMPRSNMKDRIARLRYVTLVFLSGCVALGLVTWLCLELGLEAVGAESLYLIVIVLVSLLDSFAVSALLSLISVFCLDFFFIKPIFKFQMQFKDDMPALITFLIASLAVTALVRHIRKLGEAQSEQDLLLDLTHDTVIVRDMIGEITYWNRGAEELYGWTKRDAVGKNIHDFLRTRFPLPLVDITDTLVRTGRWDGELIHTKRDGTEVIVASRWSLQRDANGKPHATLESGNDITARRRAEELLKQSQATSLAEAQKLSRTGSFGWDVASGEVFWSEESFRIFEYDPGVHATVDLIIQRVHPDDRARMRRLIDFVTDTRQDFDVEHRLLMPDGSTKHLHVVARAASDESGDLRFVGAIMDVTATKQAEQQLHEAQTELARVTRVTTLGELSASIAHEVGQPLSAIVTNGEACLRWLGRETPQLDEVQSCVTSIISEGRRAGEIVHRIRTLAKRDTPAKMPLDLSDVINDVVILTQREVLNHQVALRLKLATGLPPLLGDRVQLQQVIINLVMNGLQSMNANGNAPRELTIESRQDDDGHLVVEVQDTGTGIEPENSKRLFDAFFSTKPNGMGIGLSICRSIIEAHGGRMRASNNAGRGATFQCSLPPLQDAA
ncbi:PAS domain S-box-containing protein [Paraburkholderia sp. BL8N3]|nr:ATP-binding protein [Paraburkholderia sp. BL8N3]TCK34541.1 PAS domain S-box-containing protein [Paraburkholderia sp. BL8N3]